MKHITFYFENSKFSNKTRFLRFVSILFLLSFFSITSFGAARIASSSGNWNSSSTWGGNSSPTSSDDVTINAGISVTIPNSTAACKSLKLNNGSSGTATIIFNKNSKLVVSNLVTLSGNSAGKNGTLDMTNTSTLECNGFVLGSGTVNFIPGAGTIQLNASNTLPLSTFNNVIIKTGTTTLGTNITINGNLTIGLAGTNVGVIDVSTNNYGISIYGDFIHNNPNSGFVERNGTVTFLGTSNQSSYFNGDPETFYNLVINKPSGIVTYTGSGASNSIEVTNLTITSGTLTLGTNSTKLKIFGNVSISGTLDLSPSYITIPADRSTSGGSFTITNTGIVKLGGTNTFSQNYSTYSLASSSTVDYNGTNQNVTGGINYGNLLISSAGTKTLTSHTSIAGNLTVSAGAFNVNAKNITLNGTTNQEITGASFYNLIVNNTGSNSAIILKSATTVNQNATFTDGVIDATLFPLTFEAASTVSTASNGSHVKGIVKKITNSTTTFIFPTGDGMFYRPITIKDATNDTWTAQYFNYSYGNVKVVDPTDNPKINHVSALEYWDLYPALSTSSTKIDLTWNINSDVISPQNLVISHWNTTNSYWENLGPVTLDTISNTISSTIFANSFSPFTLGSITGDDSLPIELLYVQSNCGQEDLVNIEWATASENNNEYFSVLRSNDGITWTKIAKIAGAGTSKEIKKYTFVDQKPTMHDTYYKIAQTDYNGTNEEFDIMSIYCLYNHKHITLSPNPAQDYIMLNFYNEHHIIDVLTVKIFNESGQLATTQYFQSESDDNSHRIELPENLKNGMYFIQITLGSNSFYSSSFLKN